MLPELEWQDTTAGKIRQIPDIIRELAALDGTRNPDTQQGAMQRHTQAGSKPPVNETVVFLVDDREDSPWGGLSRLQNVSRTVWGNIPDGEKFNHPQPQESSWDAECAWLATLWADARWLLPQPVLEACISQIEGLYSALAHAIGLYEPVPASCPQCAGVLTDRGSVMVCQRCGKEYPSPTTLRRHWKHHEPMVTKDLVGALPGLTSAMLWQWKKRGKVKPAATVGKANAWVPWDVISVLWPDIVSAIDEGSVSDSSVVS